MDGEIKHILLNPNKNGNVINMGTKTEKEDKIKDEDFGHDPIKQLEAIIKQETSDIDDDSYYVVVIGDDNENQKTNEIKELISQGDIKTEVIEQPKPVNNVKVEPQEKSKNEQCEHTLNSHPMSDINAPLNVLSMLLEHEVNLENAPAVTDKDKSEEKTSRNYYLVPVELAEEEIVEIISTNLIIDPTNVIKIIDPTVSEGTVVFENVDGSQCLNTTELITAEENKEVKIVDESSQEMILWEGDDLSQFRIFNYDGLEYIIEGADDVQLGNIQQQEDSDNMSSYCGGKFDKLSIYQKLKSKHHSSEKHYCSMCKKTFKSVEILTGHMLLHKVTTVLVGCPFCQEIVRRNMLTPHIRCKHSKNAQKPKCDICFKTFASATTLKSHMLIHDGVRKFECDMCPKKFHQKITMQRHRLQHMNLFACNQCGQIFNTKHRVDKHKEWNQCLNSKSRVIEEVMRKARQQIATKIGTHIGYFCSLCKRMFFTKSDLGEHVESTHVIGQDDLICAKCNQVLPSKDDLSIHMQVHRNNQLKKDIRFQCSICGKSCSCPAKLVMHERVHTNERPFPCQLCSLCFKTKTHLTTHMLTHTREKKYGCSVCFKFFAQRGNLIAHIRLHTGERPYVCPLCSEAFIDTKCLRKHKRIKHP